MTLERWEQIKAMVAAALKGALASGLRRSRASLIRWARKEARNAAQVARLSTRAAREVDQIVDSAIAAAG